MSFKLTATTEMEEEMTPDSSKSTQQKLKETITGTGDKVARYASLTPAFLGLDN